MPPLGPFHPQIVHFVIALGLVGVALRWLSLTGKVPFAGPAATTLLVATAIAAVLAVTSGAAAHETVEGIPGVGAAVRDHEQWGERTRTVFLIIAALEVLGLAFTRRPALRGGVRLVSALAGLWGAYAIYQVGHKGGVLVYSYAGGPGLRSGDTADVARLLTAGLYAQAQVERDRHQPAAAAQLIEELARRAPGDTAFMLLRIDSQLRDRQDATGALAALHALAVSPDNPRFVIRSGMLEADAYVAAGQPDSARAVMRRLVAGFPAFQRLKDRLTQLGG